MSTSKKKFFVMLAYAVALATAAYITGYYLNSRVQRANTACEIETVKRKMQTPEEKALGAPWERRDWRYPDSPCPETQYFLDDATESLSSNGDYVVYGYMLAFVIAIIGALPLCWYFLLARLREVAEAVSRGK